MLLVKQRHLDVLVTYDKNLSEFALCWSMIKIPCLGGYFTIVNPWLNQSICDYYWIFKLRSLNFCGDGGKGLRSDIIFSSLSLIRYCFIVFRFYYQKAPGFFLIVWEIIQGFPQQAVAKKTSVPYVVNHYYKI
jgi:hypothetical protein